MVKRGCKGEIRGKRSCTSSGFNAVTVVISGIWVNREGLRGIGASESAGRQHVSGCVPAVVLVTRDRRRTSDPYGERLIPCARVPPSGGYQRRLTKTRQLDGAKRQRDEGSRSSRQGPVHRCDEKSNEVHTSPPFYIHVTECARSLMMFQAMSTTLYILADNGLQ